MKASVLTSLVLHTALLVWLTVSFGSPEAMTVASEAMPVELVPVEEFAQMQQGDKTAPKKEESALQETKKQDQVPDAQNTGENKFDLDTVPVPSEKPSNLQKAGAPEKADQEVKETKTGDDSSPDEPQVEPTQELAALAQEKVEVKPEPRPDPQVSEEKPVENTSDQIPLPDSVPVPSLRPEMTEEKKEEKKPEEKKAEEKPTKKDEKKKTEKKNETAEAKTAKTEERKKEEKKGKSSKAATTQDSDFNSGEIATLLNKTEDKSGGAKRSSKSKAFGGDKNTGAKLSQSEMDALKGMIQENWTIMNGQVTSNDIVITVKFELDENGELVGRPEVEGSGGEDSSRRALELGAVRAVMKSAPFDKLPKDKYDTWKVVTVNFRPSEMM